MGSAHNANNQRRATRRVLRARRLAPEDVAAPKRAGWGRGAMAIALFLLIFAAAAVGVFIWFGDPLAR